MAVDIGIDLGTDSVLVYVKGRGVVLAEPSVIALDLCTNAIKAAGEEALLMRNRASGSIIVIRPVKKGVIPEYNITKKMIKYFIGKSLGKKLFMRPHVAVCVPYGASGAERNALEQAALFAGARDVRFTDGAVAAALGAGIDIFRACANMIVDIGGGRTDIAVISSGKTVEGASLDIAGGDFDKAIVRYMRKKHSLVIGGRAAEDIKIKIGTVCPAAGDAALEVSGRDLLTGIQKTMTVTSSETQEALANPAARIVEEVLSVLEMTSPRLSADIKERGIVLTGGGSLLRGLELLIEEKTGVHAVTAQEPASAAVVGTGLSA